MSNIDIGIVETPTVRQAFMDRIVGMIVSGELKPGDKLPSERDMAAQSKISKSAVHFAMVELERMGFVKTILRQGTYVQDYITHGTAESLNLLTHTKNFKYTDAHVSDIIDMRDAIESAALVRLMDNLTEEALAAFREDIEASKAIAAEGPDLDVPKLARSFFHFHHNICVYSGNFVLPLIFNSFKESTSYFWETPIRVFGADRCIEMMEEVYRTIETGDADICVKYLRDQLDLFRDVISGKVS